MLLNGFGLYCDCCGVCADQDCVNKADKKIPCKTNETFHENMEHHWVKGNSNSRLEKKVFRVPL